MLYDKRWETKAPVRLEPWQKLLLDAADLIEKGGLAKHRFAISKSDGNTSYCAAGALTAADHAKEFLSMSVTGKTAFARFNAYIGPTRSISTWNDKPERTKEEVVTALRAAVEQEV